MTHRADEYLSVDGRATCVVGLHEEAIAMIFALYSRNPKNIRDTIIGMIDSGDLPLGDSHLSTREERDRVSKFHERITIGYGHKSVADHASVHFAIEGVSALLEREFLKGRLLAASAVSSRFINFSEQGFVVPNDWPKDEVNAYVDHCNGLISAYSSLVPIAVEYIRSIAKYTGDNQKIWKTEAGWEQATEKRALDLVRDLLPLSVKTSFGVTMSATGLRELLAKRMHFECSDEVSSVAREVHTACNRVFPSLLPANDRAVASAPFINFEFVNEPIYVPSTVKVMTKPDWAAISTITGTLPPHLITRWRANRPHKGVPDRASELPRYTIAGRMPIAIYRDLGRHRMMTQLNSPVNPASGYGRDPLLSKPVQSSFLNLVTFSHSSALQQADTNLRRWSHMVRPEILQYACPMATMVHFVWEVSLRQLIYMIGLRTTPQGHPAYRAVVAAMATAIKQADPMVRTIIDDVCNYDNIIIGRPG